MFNSICIKENLLPSYTNIRLHDQAVQQRNSTSDFRKKLLEEQVSLNTERLDKLQVELQHSLREFESIDISADLRANTQQYLDDIITSYSNVNKFVS